MTDFDQAVITMDENSYLIVINFEDLDRVKGYMEESDADSENEFEVLKEILEEKEISHVEIKLLEDGSINCREYPGDGGS